MLLALKEAILNIVFAFLAFVLVLGESLLVLLFPVESLVVTGVPAILFEITIGFWLMLKGVKTESI